MEINKMETVHIVPKNDMCVHKYDGSPCDCEPVKVALEYNDELIYVVKHYSWDLREAYERIIEQNKNEKDN